MTYIERTYISMHGRYQLVVRAQRLPHPASVRIRMIGINAVPLEEAIII